MPAMSALRSIIAVCACIALFSCAPKPRVVLSLEEVAPYGGPITVDVLKEHIAFREVRTLRSEVRVRAESGRRRLGNYRGALLYSRPGSVRLKLYSAFGAVGLDAVHSGGTLQIYFPQEKVLYAGESPVTGDGFDYGIRDDGEEYVLLAFGPDGLRASYVFDRSTLLNKEIDYYGEGESLLKMRFARYSNGIPLLAEIGLSNGYSVEAELIEPERDVEIPDRIFAPAIGHEGVRVFPLERLMGGEN